MIHEKNTAKIDICTEQDSMGREVQGKRWVPRVLAAVLCTSWPMLFFAGCGGSASTHGTTATPSFTPGGGSYSGSQTVTVGDATPGAVIYCTTDGTAPSSGSSICPEPITIAKSETISAVALAAGYGPSAVAKATFTIDLPPAATPTIQPAAGAYTSVQMVTISDSTPNALIYYTVDGSSPTTSSSVYTAPIPVSASGTVNAIAVAPGYVESAVVSAAYIINLPTATPVISSSTGSTNATYGIPLTVTIADADPNATIYYAIGGAATTSSTKYSGPLSVTAPEAISAVALDSAGGFSISASATQAFTVTEATPLFSKSAGVIPWESGVSITDADPGATIYYTIGSTAPSTASQVYTGPVTVSSNETINAIAVNTALSYLQSAVASVAYTIPNPTPAPAILSAGGTSTTYPAALSVSITDSDSAAAIYYTLDGSTPSSTHGTLYSGSFTVASSETVRAMAIDTAGGNPPSSAVSQLFTVREATPTFSPSPGTIPSGTQVRIADADPAAVIYYTTNGDPATTSASPYNGPITLNSSATIHAIAIDTAAATNFTQSLDASASYTVKSPAPTPVIVSAGGATSTTYGSTFSVSITDSDSTASLYYTTDGSAPSATHGTLYSGAFKVSSTETVTAVAVDSLHGYLNSAPAAQLFTIIEAKPVIAPPAGTVSSGTKVTITDADPGASIYYTTNGSPATTSSTPYTGAITIATSETINAIAADTTPGAIYAPSLDASAAYTVPGAAPTPVITSAGGATSATYPSALMVSLTDSDANASLFYTTDGSTPSATHGSPYGGAFKVSSTETVTAVAVDSSHGYLDSAPAFQLFTIVEAAPVIAPPAGSVLPGTKVTISDIDPEASIFYTTDGSPATTSSTRYTGSITITTPVTINSVAVDTTAGANYTQSLDASAAYTFQEPTPTPVISSTSGTSATYPTTLAVTIGETDAKADIYYTTDGSTPSVAHGTRYTAAITVASTETITAIAIDPSFENSSIVSQTFTITEATPQFTTPPGVIAKGSSVTITDIDPGATIYFTTDGSPATALSTQYTGPIAVSISETINAVAIDTNSATNYALSADASGDYTPYSGPVISGTVVSGSLPLAGATITLYAAGTQGYGQGAKPLTTTPGAIVTNSTGGFALGYNCPGAPGDQLYLLAAGGSTSGGASESNLALMTALGSCSKLTATTAVTINEVTTIASAYALAGFAAPSPSGPAIVVGAPAPNTTCTSAGASTMGKSTCNYRGLVNAFRTISNLVNLATGVPLAITEFYSGGDPNNLNGWSSSYGDPHAACPGAACLSPSNPVPAAALNTSTAPYQRLNTLGNVLASCVEASGNCAALSSLTGSAGDTLQSALYIAQHPGAWSGTSGLYGLIAKPASPFTPPYGNASSTLSAEPNDWTLALSFTGAGLGIDPQTDMNDQVTGLAMAIDVNGNVWVSGSALDPSNATGNTVGMIAGFDPLGEALTPPTSLPNGAIGYDLADQYSTYGGFGPDAKSGGVFSLFGEPNAFVVDALQHLWVSNSYEAYDPGGSRLTIASNPAPGAAHNLTASSSSPSYFLPDESSSIAVDNSGTIWQSGGVLTLWQYDTSGNILNSVPITFGPSTSTNVQSVCNFAFDANGTLWGDDCGTAGNGGQAFAMDPSSGTVLATYSGAQTEFTPNGTLVVGAGSNVFACNSARNGYLVFNTSNLAAPVNTFSPSNGRCGRFLTVDGSGNIWSYGQVHSSFVLDEVTPTGTQITPDSGLTGSSADEVNTTGLTTFNETASWGSGAIAIDRSGNLWFLNGAAGTTSVSVTPSNSLEEFIGIAAPTVTPTAIATQNGAQGTRP